jgi:RecB family exonuclease
MKKPMLANASPKAFSHLETYDVCPLQYKFKHIDKIKHERPDNLKFGTGFHEWRYRYYEELRRTRQETDWDVVPKIAKAVFHESELPLDRWPEFLALCRTFAENRPFSRTMGIEIRFGVNRDGTWSTFEECDGFRGVVDGLEIKEDTATVTDAKTARSMDLPFTQLETYAAFLSIRYPQVARWRLVYDFVRYGRTTETEVLTENLPAFREVVMARVAAIEKQKTFKPQPSENCLECAFLGRCDYKMVGITKPRTPMQWESFMQDYFMHKAKAQQLKKVMKLHVDNHGDILGDRLTAAYFPHDTKSCDKVELIKLLKKIGKNPVTYVEFPAASLDKLRFDKKITDDVANVIFIDTIHRFDVKRRPKGESP